MSHTEDVFIAFYVILSHIQGISNAFSVHTQCDRYTPEADVGLIRDNIKGHFHACFVGEIEC